MTEDDTKFKTDSDNQEVPKGDSRPAVSTPGEPSPDAGQLPDSSREAAAAPGENGAAMGEAQEGNSADNNESPAEGGGNGELEPGEEQDELETLRAEAQNNYDKFLRLNAEFENFKKRMHKEKAESLKYAQMPVLKELISILDNFERAVDHAKSNQGQDPEALISGIELVLKQLSDTFERFGMIRINAKGEPFDPTRHEAMGVVETDEVAENQVMEEFQAGYMLHDRVVRPAMVTVSKKGAAPQAQPPDAGEPKN